MDKVDDSLVALDEPFNRPLLIGCTWYTYGMDELPWGVAQNDLLIGRIPASLLLATSLICDTNAFKQEKYARDELGWTSSELLVKLKKKGILELHDFGPSVKSIFEERDLRKDLEKLLSSGLTGNELLKQVRASDKIISEGLSAEDTGISNPDPKQIFHWKEDPSQHSKPFWSTAEKIVLPLFIDRNFFLLPPRHYWPQNVKEALNEIMKRQAPYIEDLARLRVEPQKYLHRIKDAHGKYDEVIDKFLRSYSNDNDEYGDYSKRFDFLMKVRKKLHNTSILDKMKYEWSRVRHESITKQEYEEKFTEQIMQETKGLLKAKRDNKTDICINLTISATSISGIYAGVVTNNQPLTAVSFSSLTFSSTKLVRAICQRLNLGQDFPMGWLAVERARKEGRKLS